MTDTTETVETDGPPDNKPSSRTVDILERAVWTLVQAASATGLVAAYQAAPWRDMSDQTAVIVIIIITPVLSALKGAIFSAYGNGSASSLPIRLEPVPAEDVIAKESASGVAVAGQAPVFDEDGQDAPMGTPVIVSVPRHAEEDDLLPDEGDTEHVAVPIPDDGYDDGTGNILLPDGTVRLKDGTIVKPEDLS